MKYFCKSRNKQRFVIANLSLLFYFLEVLLSANSVVANSCISSDIKEILPPQRYHAIYQTLFSFGILSLPPCEREIIFFFLWGFFLFLFKIIQAWKELPMNMDETDILSAFFASAFPYTICLIHLTAFYEG